jgi:hypothetical protein
VGRSDGGMSRSVFSAIPTPPAPSGSGSAAQLNQASQASLAQEDGPTPAGQYATATTPNIPAMWEFVRNHTASNKVSEDASAAKADYFRTLSEAALVSMASTLGGINTSRLDLQRCAARDLLDGTHVEDDVRGRAQAKLVSIMDDNQPSANVGELFRSLTAFLPNTAAAAATIADSVAAPPAASVTAASATASAAAASAAAAAAAAASATPAPAAAAFAADSNDIDIDMDAQFGKHPYLARYDLY